MSAEPALDRTALHDALEARHGLRVDALAFLSNGTVPAYRVDGPEGRFFVKVVPDTPFWRTTSERIRAEIPLLNALRRSDVLPNVPRPVPDRDGGHGSLASGHALFVFEWIEGGHVGARWAECQGELAASLGRLHAGTPNLSSVLDRLPVAPEDFAFPFEDGLRGDLARLKIDARPGPRALRDLLAPHADGLRRVWEQARVFQVAARSNAPAFVVCHTDAHGGNVMRDAEGRLWLVDWETARLAPPEHDLWMLPNLEDVLPAYEASAGRGVTLDRTVLGFYVCRRVLEDLAMDVHLILHENTRPEEDAANLNVLRRFILPSVERALTDLRRLSV